MNTEQSTANSHTASDFAPPRSPEPARPEGHPATWSMQEMFSYIVRYQRWQGVKAFCDLREQCMYRTPNGAKCAWGCVVPDDEYMKGMEGRACDCLMHGYMPGMAGFAMRMQEIHDRHEVADWEDRWTALANDYTLSVPR